MKLTPGITRAGEGVDPVDAGAAVVAGVGGAVVVVDLAGRALPLERCHSGGS